MLVGDCEVRRDYSDKGRSGTDKFFDYLGEEIQRYALECEFTGFTAVELIERFEWVTADIEQTRAKVFSDVPMIFELIKEDTEAVNRLSRFLQDGLELLTILLAVKLAIFTEVHKRARSNGVNYYFGALLMAHVDADSARQENAFRQLRTILLSIPRKEGWFHSDPGQWQGIIDEVLAEQCRKHDALGRGEILRRILENGFAVVYKAVQDRMVDEVRRRVRRKNEVSEGAAEVFDRVPAPQMDPDYDLQRFDVIRLLEHGLSDVKESDAAILGATADCLRGDMELIEKLTTREIHSWFVKELSGRRSITERQAQKI